VILAVKSDRQVIIEIKADLSNLKMGLQKLEQSVLKSKQKVESLSSKVEEGFGELPKIFEALTGVIAFDKIRDGVNQAIEAFAGMEATATKLVNVFPTLTNEVRKWSVQFAQSIGASQSEILDVANNFGDLAIGLGLSEKSAMYFSEGLTQLAYDLAYANYSTLSTKDAIEAMQSGIVGEYEALRKLGMSLNEVTLTQSMMELGLEGQFHQLSENEKMLVRYYTIMKQSAISINYASENSTSLIGILERLRSQGIITQQVVGKALAPAFLLFSNIMLGYVFPAIQYISIKLGQFFEGVRQGGTAFYVLLGIFTTVSTIIMRGLIMWIITKSKFIQTTMTSIKTIALEAITASKLAWEMLIVNKSVTQAIRAFSLMNISMKNVLLTVTTLITNFMLFSSLFTSAKNWKPPKVKPPKILSGKELQKVMADELKRIKNFNNAVGKNNKKQESLESKLNKELKRLYKERVKAYTDMGKFFEGVQRKILGVNNILKGAQSSVNAIKEFNNGIEILKQRIGNSDLGKQFIAELQALDPDKYASYITALANASDKQLKKIVELWGERHKEAGKKAKEEVANSTPEIKETLKEGLNLDQNTLNNLGTSIGQGVVDAIGEQLANSVPDLSEDLSKGIEKSFEEMMKGNKKELIYSSVGTFVGGIVGAVFGQGIGALIGAQIGGALGSALATLNWKELKEKFLNSNAIKSLKNWGSDVAQKISDGLKNLPTIMGNLFDGIKGVIKNKLVGWINNLVHGLNILITLINDKFSISLPKWLGGYKWGPNIPLIKPIAFASGGIVNKATFGVFGEAGTEALIPLSNMNKMKPFAEAIARFLGGSGQGVNINIQQMVVREEADIKKIAESLYNLTKRDNRALGFVR